MLTATLSAMSVFPEQLEQCFSAVPKEYAMWAPESWEGIPSETFTALEQVCHVRDIEIDGYQMRFRRMLEETAPVLASIDSYELARQRQYHTADPRKALAEFRAARTRTLDLIRDLNEQQLNRAGSFEGYGQVTLRALIHYLSSHDQQHLSGMQWLLGKIASQPRTL